MRLQHWSLCIKKSLCMKEKSTITSNWNNNNKKIKKNKNSLALLILLIHSNGIWERGHNITLPFKLLGLVCLFTLLFNKDALVIIRFQINAILEVFLFIKESQNNQYNSFHQNITQNKCTQRWKSPTVYYSDFWGIMWHWTQKANETVIWPSKEHSLFYNIFKGLPKKMKILSLITYPHVAPNP